MEVVVAARRSAGLRRFVVLESTATSSLRYRQRRQPRRCCSSPRFGWWWTCLAAAVVVATASPGGPINFASAFAIRHRGIYSSSPKRGLPSSKSSSDDGNDGDSSPATTTTTRAASSSSFTTHSSLSELLKDFDYDALILDQFGVLHNGRHALEGATECVETIAKKNNNKKLLRLVILSNTSSPAKTTLSRLATKLGFDESCFCGAVTSGEEAARHVRETYGSSPAAKKKFVWCTWDADNDNVPDPAAFLDLCGPNVAPTVDVNEADFVVAHGSGAIRGSREGEIVSMGSFLDDGNLGGGTPISDLLERCADRSLPLVCANPDEVVYWGGILKHMPGKIARRYGEILGERNKEDDVPITIYGKPHTEHFEACLRELEERRPDKKISGEAAANESPPPLRVAHVGDSLHHDIAGANAAGIPSIFIVGGIHAEELLASEEERDSSLLPSEERLNELFAREGVTPTHVLPVFRY